MSRLGRDPADYPMPLFSAEDQGALALHVQAAHNACENRNEYWDEAEHTKVEERWLTQWRIIVKMDVKGKRPTVKWRRPHGQAQHEKVYADNDEVDDCRTGVKCPAGEINNYRSVGNNNLAAAAINSFYSRFSTLSVPAFNAQLLDRNAIALLASSSTLDVLKLIHERTRHMNKQAIIECVKSN